MDHIYPTKDYKVYKLKDEIKKLSQEVISSQMPANFDAIADEVGIPHVRLKEISLDMCEAYEDYGTDCPNSSNLESAPYDTFPSGALNLNLVKTLREGNFQFKEPKAKEMLKVTERGEEQEKSKADLEVYKDSVITVRFYEPFRYTPSLKNHPRFHQEHQVLGSNFLSELRDKFYCPCNYGPFFDISDDPHSPVEQGPTATNPGFFFIHDTFYNDTRNPLNPDYSEVILKWFKRFDYVRSFKTGIMQETKFEDLEIRFGYPCVYQHHGACEHIFCITSVDLLDNSHSLLRSDYPILSNSCRKRSTFCDICGQLDASFLVTNCPLHVKDPMRVCDNCFFSFHYSKDGSTKTCSFNAYRIYSVRPENK